MFVQLKSGYDLDRGPSWISRVRFSKSWQTAYFHGRTLRREQRLDGNFTDVDSGEVWWLSGPKRDRSDARYSTQQPVVDDDARAAYDAFLDDVDVAERRAR